MGTPNIFLGNAQDAQDVWTVTPGGVIEIGDQFSLAIGTAKVTYTAGTLTGAATVDDVVAGLVAEWTAATFVEFSGITAEDSGNGSLTLTGPAGVPFTVTATTGTTNQGSLTVAQTTVGRYPVDEVQRIKLAAGVAGGTFTYSNDFGGGAETTGNINWNATADEVRLSIEALATPVPGDLTVVKVADGDWLLHWKGALAAIDVAEGTIDGSLLTGTGAVEATEIDNGRGLSNEVQILTFTTGAGAWSLMISTDGGGTFAELSGTDSIAAAAVQTFLEATLGAGNVAVYGGRSDNSAVNLAHRFAIAFIGDLAGLNVPQLQVSLGSGSANVGAADVSTLSAGGQATSNEIQLVSFGGADGGSAIFSYGGTEVEVDFDATAAELKAAIESLGFDDVTVTGANVFELEFGGAEADTDIDLVGFNGSGLTGTAQAPAIAEVRQGGASVDEQWQVQIFGSGGTFTLTDGTDVTAAIAYGAAAATIKTRLEADIAAITTVTVTGTGTPEDPYVITVTDPAATPLSLSGDGSSLTGSDGAVTEVTPADAGQSAVFTITEDATVDGGTWDASWNGTTVTLLAWDISAAALQTQLETIFGAGNVAVAGAAGGPYTATLQSALALAAVADMTVDGTNLIGGDDTQTLTAIRETYGGGKNRFNDYRNWSLGHTIESDEDLVLEQCNRDILWNIDLTREFTADAGTDELAVAEHDFVDEQKVYLKTDDTLPAGLATATPYYVIYVDADTIQLSATRGGSAIDITDAGTGTHRVGVQVANFRRYGSFTGLIGLAKYRDGDYLEYRPRHLGIWIADGGEVIEGEGDGGLSGRSNYDFDDSQINGQVVKSGGPIESGVPPLLILNNNAASIWEQIDGDTGIAFSEDETTEFATFFLLGGNLTLGRGHTNGKIEKRGGTLVALGSAINGTIRGIF